MYDGESAHTEVSERCINHPNGSVSSALSIKKSMDIGHNDLQRAIY